MLILGIDTSTKLCSVALYDTEKGLLGEINIMVAKNHSHVILPIIDQLLGFAEKKTDDIEKIVVGVGPGSFTGIRVGMAIAKGLAIGKKVPIFGISGLDALAASCKEKGRIFSFIDARKGRVYYRVFDGENACTEAKDGYIEDVLREYKGATENYFLGDGALVYQSTIKEIYGENARIISEENTILRAIYFIQASLKKEEDNLYTLEPLYICKSQAEKMKENV